MNKEKILEEFEEEVMKDGYYRPMSKPDFKNFLVKALTSHEEELKKKIERKEVSFWFELVEEANKQTAEDQMDSYLNNAGKLRERILQMFSELNHQ